MIIYIIKFSLCLLLILLFYKYVLENEKAHHFKRFYLLIGLFLALIIPLISLSYPVVPFVDVTVLRFNQEVKQVFLPIKAETIQGGAKLSAIPFLVIYLAGVLFFSLRFIISLKNINFQIAIGKKIRYRDYILVLTNDNVMHHSFLNFIFINREKYEKGKIPFEIIRHEQVHVRQKHTLDLLLVETLHVFLWFNPLIIFYRSLIKRNHEFLADEGVLCQHSNPSRYAQILLNQTLRIPNQSVLSYFKDDFVKNRILMMTNSFSLKVLLVKLTGLLPLLAITFSLFSNMGIAGNAPTEFNDLQEYFGKNPSYNQQGKTFYIDVLINSNKDISVQNQPLKRIELNPTIQEILSSSRLDSQEIVVRIYAHGSLPVGFITDVEYEIFRANSNIRARKRFILESSTPI